PRPANEGATAGRPSFANKVGCLGLPGRRRRAHAPVRRGAIPTPPLAGQAPQNASQGAPAIGREAPASIVILPREDPWVTPFERPLRATCRVYRREVRQYSPLSSSDTLVFAPHEAQASVRPRGPPRPPRRARWTDPVGLGLNAVSLRHCSPACT